MCTAVLELCLSHTFFDFGPKKKQRLRNFGSTSTSHALSAAEDEFDSKWLSQLDSTSTVIEIPDSALIAPKNITVNAYSGWTGKPVI